MVVAQITRFRLDDSSTAQLIEDACRAERRAIDLYQFTRLLNEGLDDRGRARGNEESLLLDSMQKAC